MRWLSLTRKKLLEATTLRGHNLQIHAGHNQAGARINCRKTDTRPKEVSRHRRSEQNKPLLRRPRKLDKRHRLYPHHVKALPAPHVLASHRVVPPNHVALCLGKTRPVTVVGPSRQLRLLPPHHPVNLILALLSTVRTCHHVRPLLRLLIKKVPLFHTHLAWPAAPASSRRPICNPA